MKKVIRTSTIALSLDLLLNGQLAFLNREYEIIAVSGEDQNLQNVRQREKVRTHAIPMERQISPVKDVVALWKLYRFFKKEKPFIVHSITPKAGLLSMTAARFAGVPVRIHTFTGLIFPTKTGIFKSILILMDRVLCKMATRIYPEGEGVKKDLIDYRITSKPLRVIANGNVNGINTAFYDPSLYSEDQKSALKQQLGIAKADTVFVFVGRLVGDKGINELVSAFDMLQTDKSVKLLLVGPREDDLDPLLPDTIDKIETNPNIVLVGFQSDVRSYLAISHILTFPSYREGFPNVVMQAGAMGLPSIVSNINGCNEIINDGENGLIVPAKNQLALREAMERLLNEPALYDKLRSNARKMIVDRYEQSVVWDAILAEYRTFDSENPKHVPKDR